MVLKLSLVLFFLFEQPMLKIVIYFEIKALLKRNQLTESLTRVKFRKIAYTNLIVIYQK